MIDGIEDVFWAFEQNLFVIALAYLHMETPRFPKSNPLFCGLPWPLLIVCRRRGRRVRSCG